MFACNSTLYQSCDRCAFCLGDFNQTLKPVIIKNSFFRIQDKQYQMNCSCAPLAHHACMRDWFKESNQCPECSVIVGEIEQKKGCSVQPLLCLCFVCAFIAITIYIAIDYAKFMQNL